MPDLNGWPVWAGIVVIAILQIVNLLKEPLKNAAPDALKGLIRETQSKRLGKWYTEHQENELFKEIIHRLLDYVLDTSADKLDTVAARQESVEDQIDQLISLMEGASANNVRTKITRRRSNAVSKRTRRRQQTGKGLPFAPAEPTARGVIGIDAGDSAPDGDGEE